MPVVLSLVAHLKLRRVGDLGNGLNDVPHNLSCLSFCDDPKQRPQLRQEFPKRLCVLLLHVYVAEALDSLQSTQKYGPGWKGLLRWLGWSGVVSSQCITHFNSSVRILQLLVTALQACCSESIIQAITNNAAHLLLCFDGLRIVGMLP